MGSSWRTGRIHSFARCLSTLSWEFHFGCARLCIEMGAAPRTFDSDAEWIVAVPLMQLHVRCPYKYGIFFLTELVPSPPAPPFSASVSVSCRRSPLPPVSLSALFAFLSFLPSFLLLLRISTPPAAPSAPPKKQTA